MKKLYMSLLGLVGILACAQEVEVRWQKDIRSESLNLESLILEVRLFLSVNLSHNRISKIKITSFKELLNIKIVYTLLLHFNSYEFFRSRIL
ncbi:hypothetical protein [Cloacibacterium sp.]|uniref:hypothetical protein n=1 Tax=Cloacibacterium sp. TaxID=1913682 RepID=UPI0039E607E3